MHANISPPDIFPLPSPFSPYIFPLSHPTSLSHIPPPSSPNISLSHLPPPSSPHIFPLPHTASLLPKYLDFPLSPTTSLPCGFTHRYQLVATVMAAMLMHSTKGSMIVNEDTDSCKWCVCSYKKRYTDAEVLHYLAAQQQNKAKKYSLGLFRYSLHLAGGQNYCWGHHFILICYSKDQLIGELGYRHPNELVVQLATNHM